MSNAIHHVILDIETLRSADDCLHCGKDFVAHTYGTGPTCLAFEKIGWENKSALGLSIGCYWDSRDGRTYFFDEGNLQETIQKWVDEQPLIVTFNGIQFDLPLLRGILRRRADMLPPEDSRYYTGPVLMALCDAFKALCTTSYDVLAMVC